VEIAICNSRQSEIEFENVTFSDNSASEEGGGAINILWNEELNSDNHVILNNVQFLRNYAHYGGGIAVAVNTKVTSDSYVLFIGCLWEDNSALFGSAVDIFPEKIINDQVVVSINVSDCNFINNSNCNMPNEYTSGFYQRGFGTIMIAGYRISFIGTIQFLENSGSCIYAVGSEVHFDGANISFDRNIAEYGSGIALTGLSKITTNHNCLLSFCGNYAEKTSPTIYYYPIDKHHFLDSKHNSYDFIFNSNGRALFEEKGNLQPTDKKYPDSGIGETLTSLNGIKFSHSNSCKYQPLVNDTLLDFKSCKSKRLFESL